MTANMWFFGFPKINVFPDSENLERFKKQIEPSIVLLIVILKIFIKGSVVMLEIIALNSMISFAPNKFACKSRLNFVPKFLVKSPDLLILIVSPFFSINSCKSVCFPVKSSNFTGEI